MFISPTDNNSVDSGDPDGICFWHSEMIECKFKSTLTNKYFWTALKLDGYWLETGNKKTKQKMNIVILIRNLYEIGVIHLYTLEY